MTKTMGRLLPLAKVARVQRVLVRGALVMTLLCSGLYGQRDKACWDKATTQLAMDECAGAEYQKADAEMNRVYQELLGRVKGDTVAAQRLREAQRAWVAYRDAHLKALYPEREAGYYGSVLPMCKAQALAQVTRERVKTLRGLLDVEEGDACGAGQFQR